MNNQNLIIYQFNILYQILKDLDLDLNFDVIEAKNEEFLRNKTYLIVRIQRKVREFIKKKMDLLKSPKALRYREIHGRYPTYYQFYNNKLIL